MKKWFVIILSVINFTLNGMQQARRDLAEQRRLVAAIEIDSLPAVQLFIEKERMPVRILRKRDELGFTPLHRAAVSGSVPIVDCIARHLPADARLKTNHDQESALHLAAATGNVAVAQLLIDTYKLDQNQTDNLKRTALHHAALNGHLEMTRLLVERYACDPMARDWLGQTPAHLAARGFHLETLLYLVDQAHTDSRAVDDNGQTLVHKLAHYTKIPTTDLEIEFFSERFGIDPLARDCYDQTAYMLASEVRYLAERDKLAPYR